MAFVQLIKVYAIVCLYVLFCTVVARIGGKRLIGYWGTLFLALVVTPLPILLILILFDRKKQQSEDKAEVVSE